MRRLSALRAHVVEGAAVLGSQAELAGPRENSLAEAIGEAWQPAVDSRVPHWCTGAWQREIITFAEDSYLGRPVSSLQSRVLRVIGLTTRMRNRRCPPP